MSVRALQGLGGALLGSLSRTYATEAVVAVGSNQGDRVSNVWAGLASLTARQDTEILQYGCLYETKPAYLEDQGDFLNTAVLVRTELGPIPLLDALKRIELECGRDVGGGIRYGPRPLDLDVVFYGGLDFRDERLEVPHPRWRERSFVVAPVCDLLPVGAASGAGSCSGRLEEARDAWRDLGGEASVGGDEIRRVIPTGSGEVVSLSDRSHIMGILNATPDSFSDGGLFQTTRESLTQARRMAREGATIVDVGGQSTRPGADRVGCQEELDRVLPVVEAIKGAGDLSRVLVSVDTFYAQVAEEAVRAGADLVNDVSSGSLDADMHGTVARLGVPYVMMHMRGDPKTMQSAQNTSYADLVSDIASELDAKVDLALDEGMMPWCVITDPGVGFAKTHDQNCEILCRAGEIRRSFAKGFLRRAPMMVGPSRKGFLGRIVGKEDPKERDVATAAAAALASAQGCNLFRVHNVGVASDALRVADAVGAFQPGRIRLPHTTANN